MGKMSQKTRPKPRIPPVPPRSEALAAIVARAYEAFGVYETPKSLDVCLMECCMDQPEVDLLLSTRLAEIPRNLLAVYNDSARSKVQDVHEIKYFLPRYLELLCELNGPSHNTEITLGRLATMGPDKWTKSEYKVLTDFAEAFFLSALHAPLRHGELGEPDILGLGISEVLVMLWRANIDVEPLLKTWEGRQDERSILHFSELAVHGVVWSKSPPELENAFGEPHMAAQLVDWLKSPTVRATFGGAIEALMVRLSPSLEEAALDLLSWAYEVINKATPTDVGDL